MPGPRPEPTAVKIAKGNPGKRKLNDLEPTPRIGEPPMPSGLSRFAKMEWKRIIPILLDMNVLTVADGAALAVYCEAYATYKAALATIKKDGRYYDTPTGQKRPHPAVLERDKSIAVMKAYQIEFGLTPSSRSRMKVERPKEVDPFEQFLNSSRDSNPVRQ